MKKYIITIVDLLTGTQQNLVRDEENIENTIYKELGGWDNMSYSSNSDWGLDADNAQFAGITKNRTKMFSILCYVPEHSSKLVGEYEV